MKNNVRVGLGQILVEGGEVETNLMRAAGAIRKGGEAGCDFVVLPECLNCGWTFPGTSDLAEPIPGPHFERLREAAANSGVYAVAGLAERDGGDVYNSAVLISPGGELVGLHRKINELEIGHQYYGVGDRLSVVKTPFGIIGVNICADNFPDSLVFGHALCRMGCQLLLSPCAWAVDGDHDNGREPYGDLWRRAYGELARLYGVAVVGVSNVGPLRAGPWAGRKCIGCSLVIGADGGEVLQGPYGEEAFLTVELELRPPRARGTGYAAMLGAAGYRGP